MSEFEKSNVEYLLVGAYALATHGIPRATGDIDLWIRTSTENAHKVLDALSRYGAPTGDLSVSELETKDLVFQIGVSPRRIDVLTSIDGVAFDEAYPRRLTTKIEGSEIPVISREDLIANKLATGRPQDLVDVKQLRKGE